MNEAEIFELLRRQEEEIRREPVFYIHYNRSSYRIVSLKNYLDTTDTLPYIQLTQKDFDFANPEFNIVNYVVDPADKKLIKIEDNLSEIKTIDAYIYEIPRIVSSKRLTYADVPFDLLIEQNNEVNEFRIKLSKMLKEQISLQNLLAQETSIFVTAINDPNILYKTLKFTFKDVIYNEYYTIPFGDFKGSKSNIYAIRYFENYLHVDIRKNEQ